MKVIRETLSKQVAYTNPIETISNMQQVGICHIFRENTICKSGEYLQALPSGPNPAQQLAIEARKSNEYQYR